MHNELISFINGLLRLFRKSWVHVPRTNNCQTRVAIKESSKTGAIKHETRARKRRVLPARFGVPKLRKFILNNVDAPRRVHCTRTDASRCTSNLSRSKARRIFKYTLYTRRSSISLHETRFVMKVRSFRDAKGILRFDRKLSINGDQLVPRFPVIIKKYTRKSAGYRIFQNRANGTELINNRV